MNKYVELIKNASIGDSFANLKIEGLNNTESDMVLQELARKQNKQFEITMDRGSFLYTVVVPSKKFLNRKGRWSSELSNKASEYLNIISKVEELTNQLREEFSSNDVAGILAVIERNTETYDENVYILDNLEDAKKEANMLWCHLTKKEQDNREISVCLLSASIDEEGKITPFYENKNGNIDSTIYEEFEWMWK